MQFTKLKFSKGTTQLSWKTKTEHDELEHHIASDEAPDVDLVTAFTKLGVLARAIFGAPAPWGADLACTSVSLTIEDDGALGCVLSGTVPLAATKAPLNFNLPYLREHPEGQPLPGFFPEGMLEVLNAVQEAAARFVKGHRAQQRLALEGDEK